MFTMPNVCLNSVVPYVQSAGRQYIFQQAMKNVVYVMHKDVL